MLVSKGLMGLAALIAGGLVTIDEMVVAGSRPIERVVMQAETGDAQDYVALRAQADSALNILLERRKAAERAQAEAAARPRCPEQVWPYYSSDCLALPEGSPARRSVRIVGIEGSPISSLQRVSF